MLNLIGNSCAASFITHDWLKHAFINPICYSELDFNSMVALISHFDNIDFNHIDIMETNMNDWCILINDLVKVHYRHLQFSPTVKYMIDTNNHNIVSNHIWEYMVSFYFRRLKRMKENLGQPIFICASAMNAINNYTPQQLKYIYNMNSKYPIIIASKHNLSLPNIDSREYIVLPKHGISTNGRPMGNYIWQHSILLQQHMLF